ncbi:MAG: YbjN domain-containing protein [Magnetococcales bacterium]|nr:YbjN domain-containing protein [Magnetococcales bacterium]
MSQAYDRMDPSFMKEFDTNPLGLIEEYAIEQDLSSERTNENELWIELPSQWGNHRLWVTYHEVSGLLQYNCYINLKIPNNFLQRIAELILMINGRVWLGHFEVWMEELAPVFRVVAPLRGSTLAEEQIEDTFMAIGQEIDRYYTAFQWVIWGGKSPAEAIAASMIDTEGEA